MASPVAAEIVGGRKPLIVQAAGPAGGENDRAGFDHEVTAPAQVVKNGAVAVAGLVGGQFHGRGELGKLDPVALAYSSFRTFMTFNPVWSPIDRIRGVDMRRPSWWQDHHSRPDRN